MHSLQESFCSSSAGMEFFNGDSEHLQGILQGHTCTVETFGYGAENDLIAQKVEGLKKEHGALGVKISCGRFHGF